VFLDIELQNHVSFRIVYYLKSNIFSDGAIGNKAIKDLIEQEADAIQSE